MATHFEQFSDADAADLIREFPLAWVRAASGIDPLQASMLPLLAERDDSGRIVALLGHMARRNPLFDALSLNPGAAIFFQGPQGYISPSWVRDRQWAPTWNFAQLRIEADIVFEPEGGDASLQHLVDAMEGERENRWRIDEMGPRYRAMERQIIAFRAPIRRLSGKFKLGQDERPEILADILTHLGDGPLGRWMRRMNLGRWPPNP